MEPASVKLVRSGELGPAAATSGMHRRQAFATDGMWAGTVETEPGMVSGWHHHGQYETTIHVITGGMRLEFGAGGADAVGAGPGDFVYVPPYAVHREGNPTDAPARALIVRAGHGPPVVNVDGPEPG
jgi:uncharacterized RmlC-like cupin family protein